MPLTNSRTWRTRLGICDYSDGCSPRNGSTTKIHSIEWIVAKARFPSSLAFGRRPSIAVFKGPSVFSKREACYWSWYWVSSLCLLYKQRSSSVCMSLLCYLSTKKKKASSWTSRRILHRRKSSGTDCVLRPYWTFHIPRNDQELLTFGLLWAWYCLRFWPFCPWSHFAEGRTLDKSASPCCWRGRSSRRRLWKKMMMLPRLSSAWPFLQQRQQPSQSF